MAAQCAAERCRGLEESRDGRPGISMDAAAKLARIAIALSRFLTRCLHRARRGVPAKIAASPRLLMRARPVLPEIAATMSLVALIWISIFVVLQREYGHELNESKGVTMALSKAYTETTARIISIIDQTLLDFRVSYQQSGADFDLRKWADSHIRSDEMRVQVAINGKDGFVVKSTLDKSNRERINVSDRPHFTFHLDPLRDELYISDPVVGRGSGERTIQFTRKLFDKDGAFDGSVLLSLSCDELSRFYSSTQGTYVGSVALIGERGAVLAAGGDLSSSIGKVYPLPPALASNDASNSDALSGRTSWDMSHGLVGLSRLRRYPVTVLISKTEDQIFARYWDIRRNFILFGVIGSVAVILLGLVWVSQRLRAVTSSRALSATLSGINQGIMMINLAGHLSVFNRRALTLLRVEHDSSFRSVAVSAINDIVASGRNANSDSFGQTAEGMPTNRIVEATTGDGTVLEVRITELPQGDVVHTLTDITEQHTAQSRIRYLAHHDVLTGLPNRALLEERILAALQHAAATGTKVSVMFLDVDGFKGVNDTIGHLVGDRLLASVAETIRTTVGPRDFVARMGGDEFVIFRTDVEGVTDAADLAPLLQSRLSEPVQIGDHELRISVSIGISLFPDDGVDHHALFSKADIALYRAKSEGRATWRVFEPWMNENLLRRVLLEDDLRNALDTGSLEIHFQPQCDSATLRPIGFEALARWNHPKHGWISPSVFIAVAEESGLISRLGAFALEQACKEAAKWPLDCHVAVNVSAFQLLDVGFVNLVKGVLARTGLPADRLELELTESAMADNSGQIVSHMASLHKLGISLALDDFGTGYSSLSNLLRFKFDKVKIDKSFVQSQREDSEARAILEAILAMSHHIGLTVIAEGVETQEQLTTLRDQGCPVVQGYLLGRPLTCQQAAEFLRGYVDSDEETVALVS
jgi:diguanylate cyclase (GGDEF)-like protein